MFNWLTITLHLIWILGLVLLLSALSLAQWQALQQRQPVRQLGREPFFHLAFMLGLGLFALGLALVVQPWWYKPAWLVLVLVSLWQGIAAWRRTTE